METCIMSHIHLMSYVFHQGQTWEVNGDLNGSINSRGSSYGSLGDLVNMTWVIDSDSMEVVLRLKQSRQSGACDDCILDSCERWSCLRHDHHKLRLVHSKYVARTMSSKKRIHPLSKRDRGISYTLGDAFTLYELVATIVDRIEKEVRMSRNLA